MQKQISITLFTSLLSAVIATSAVNADDLDIYRGGSGGIDASVLFMIDATGSMLNDSNDNDVCGDWKDPGTNDECFKRTRMHTLVTAFDTVITRLENEQKDNLKIGLSWFGGRQGSGIKFPATHALHNFAKDVDTSIGAANPADTTTVGAVLKNMVRGIYDYNEFSHSGGGNHPEFHYMRNTLQTPTVDALYEAARYFRGDFVFYGLRDKFPPWNSGLKNYKLLPEAQVVYTFTEKWKHSDRMYYGGSAKNGLIPFNDPNYSESGPREGLVLGDGNSINGMFEYTKTTGNHHGGPLEGFRAANPATYAKVTDVTFSGSNGATRNYLSLNPADDSQKGDIDSDFEYANLNTDIPVMAGTCKYYRGADDSGKPFWMDNKFSDSYYNCNLVDDPAADDTIDTKTGKTDPSRWPQTDHAWAYFNPQDNSRSGVGGESYIITKGGIDQSDATKYKMNCSALGVPACNNSQSCYWRTWASGGSCKTKDTDRNCTETYPGGTLNSKCQSRRTYNYFQFQPTVKYKSPLGECTKGAIVLLSDGSPTSNTVDYHDKIGPNNSYGATLGDNPGLVRTMIDPSQIQTSWATPSTLCVKPDGAAANTAAGIGIADFGKCGPELTAFLRDNLQSPTAANPTEIGKPNQSQYGSVDTYAIGVGVDPKTTKLYLQQLSEDADGSNTRYYDATDAANLAIAFTQIIDDVLESAKDQAVAPAISLNRNTLRTSDKVYLPMFVPNANRPSWDGNIKGYHFINGSLRDVRYDAAAVPANDYKVLNDDGSFKNTAQSFWTNGTADNGEALNGGVNAWIKSKNLIDSNNPGEYLSNSERKLYVTTFTGSPAALPAVTSATPYSITTEPAANSGKSVFLDTGNTALTLDAIGAPATADRDAIINKFRTKVLGDSLHSSPVQITYKTGSQNVLFSVSNRGLLHAFDVTNKTSDGNELWGFMPGPVVSTIAEQVSNSRPEYIYTLDGPIKLWTNDVDHDGIDVNDAGDFAYLFFGMRRGGNYYYAIDVTDISSPKILWRIKSGDTHFTKLGNTWSPISLATVKTGDTTSTTGYTTKTVAIFAGGYRSDGVDDSTGTVRSNSAATPIANSDTQAPDGLGIYLVDAKTGAFVNSIGPDVSAFKTNSGATNMIYSIPSELRIISTQGDDFTDRIYVGDMGGQIWRIDIDGVKKDLAGNPTTSIDDAGALEAILLADFGLSYENGVLETQPSVSGHRRFYYPPAVALSAPGSFAIAMGSGQRAQPKTTGVKNRFYTIYDNAASTAVLKENNLDDVTSGNITGNNPGGWMFRLSEDVGGSETWTGEKVLGSPTIFNNKVVFLTFIPDSGGACTLTGTQNLLYILDLATAAVSDEIIPPDPSNPGSPLKPGKDKQPVIIESPNAIVDAISIVTQTERSTSIPAKECFDLLAGSDNVAESCVSPTKIYWKQVQ